MSEQHHAQRETTDTKMRGFDEFVFHLPLRYVLRVRLQSRIPHASPTSSKYEQDILCLQIKMNSQKAKYFPKTSLTNPRSLTLARFTPTSTRNPTSLDITLAITPLNTPILDPIRFPLKPGIPQNTIPSLQHPPIAKPRMSFQSKSLPQPIIIPFHSHFPLHQTPSAPAPLENTSNPQQSTPTQHNQNNSTYLNTPPLQPPLNKHNPIPTPCLSPPTKPNLHHLPTPPHPPPTHINNNILRPSTPQSRVLIQTRTVLVRFGFVINSNRVAGW